MLKSSIELQKKFLTKKSLELFQKLGSQKGHEKPIAVARFESDTKNWYATEYIPSKQMFFGYIDVLRNQENSDPEAYFTLDSLEKANAKMDKIFEPCPLYQYLLKNLVQAMSKITGKVSIEIRPDGIAVKPIFFN